MTLIVADGKGGVKVFGDGPEAPCELCGQVADLRPYGPNGEMICFDCGQKDPETTAKRSNQVVFGEGFDA